MELELLRNQRAHEHALKYIKNVFYFLCGKTVFLWNARGIRRQFLFSVACVVLLHFFYVSLSQLSRDEMISIGLSVPLQESISTEK
jgi:hypothetical protein